MYKPARSNNILFKFQFTAVGVHGQTGPRVAVRVVKVLPVELEFVTILDLSFWETFVLALIPNTGCA